ncbi:Fatty acyl-CoA reductase 2-like [Senna tora]|uniref:Fatty acyl-CoA reductase 2-like n=1 Tax=Senna tora TaxID=362788 RepID=A0A835CC25_9FABA|nr:Fatty acyl-CoA reductase 2-like [Senna tora]
MEEEEEEEDRRNGEAAAEVVVEEDGVDDDDGRIPGLFADPQVIADVVPVDMVVNAVIAAIAKHGISGIPDINVYQIGSSMVNPVTLGNIMDYTYKHFKCNPLLDSKRDEISITRSKYFSSIDDFSHYITTKITKESGLMEALVHNVKPSLNTKLDRQCKKRAQFFIQMVKTYEAFGFFRGRFEIGNAQKLREEMCEEEKKMYGFEVEGIDWKEYFCSIHIPGLRKHVLKE